MQKTGRVKDKPKKQLLGEQSEVAWDTWDAKIKIKSKKKKTKHENGGQPLLRMLGGKEKKSQNCVIEI